MIRPLFLTISEQISDNIRKKIIFGELPEGTPLREADLSHEYNVSRGPVRDALKELAKEGFLDMIPNVGVKVAKAPTSGALDLIIELRKSIESFVIERVYNQFTEEDIHAIENMLDDFKYACENNSLKDVVNLDIAFHRYLVYKLDDLHIRDLWLSTVNRMLFHYNRFNHLIDSYHEHAAFFENIKSKNKEQLITMIGEHIQ